MAHNGRHSLSSEVSHLLIEIRELDAEQLYTQHGIEIHENGSVYDTTYDLTFSTINQWATFVVQQEDSDEDDDLYDKYKDNEDY